GTSVDVTDLAAQGAAVRGLPAPDALVARLVDAATLGDKVMELAFAEYDQTMIEADRRLLVALRLAPEGLDLAALLRDLYREQIIGLYVPEEKTFYVRGAPDALTPLGRTTAAHEMTHALQDRAFDLVAFQELEDREVDAALARLALVEGDAVLTERLWSERHQSAEERARADLEGLAGGFGALARAPSYVQQALFFPYVEGGAFVSSLYAAGGYAAVDAAYANPPTTTEQILHPDKYLGGEGQTPVALPESPGAGWDDGVTYTFGEFDLDELMTPLGAPAAADISAGWGGGRCARGSGEPTPRWRSTWSSIARGTPPRRAPGCPAGTARSPTPPSSPPVRRRRATGTPWSTTARAPRSGWAWRPTPTAPARRPASDAPGGGASYTGRPPRPGGQPAGGSEAGRHGHGPRRARRQGLTWNGGSSGSRSNTG
ncbi:MAG TPA: hypothetical protein VG452_05075, partial [Egibacteraceae bacterium]|nr:hypothetical protein [Egibacteraceae bacterium]